MKKLEIYCVNEINTFEKTNINGGNFFSAGVALFTAATEAASAAIQFTAGYLLGMTHELMDYIEKQN